MIDTVKLHSPAISEEQAAAVVRSAVQVKTWDNRTGEQVKVLTKMPLRGSYDSRISCQLLRHRWERPRDEGGEVVKARPIQVGCPPYISLEFSLHKFLVGHNVYGGPEQLMPAWWAAWEEIGHMLEMELPYPELWEVQRIDVAHVYDVKTMDAVQEYLATVAVVTHPRRPSGTYEHQGTFWKGDTTYDKVYGKGLEFNKHDHSRIAGIKGSEYAKKLQDRANGYLRFEVEIKAQKLRTDLYEPVAGEITAGYLESVARREWLIILKEGKEAMEVVRSRDVVRRRLREVYGNERGRNLYGYWLELSMRGGEQRLKLDVERGELDRSEFFKAKRQLKEAGCSWAATDMAGLGEGFRFLPPGFNPLDPNCAQEVKGESGEIRERTAGYAAYVASRQAS